MQRIHPNWLDRTWWARMPHMYANRIKAAQLDRLRAERTERMVANRR